MRKGRGRAAVTAETAAEAIGGAAEQFQEPIRTALADFLKSLANSDPKTAIGCADNAAGILHQLSQPQQSFFLGEAAALSSAPEYGPAAGAQFFLRCVDLPHLLDKSDLRSWIDEGKSVGIKNREAAVAYFARESASSISALKRLRRSVHIEEVGRMLGLYCSAAGGRPVGVKSTVEAPKELVRLGRHLPVTDGATIYLPEHLDEHPSHERNFDEYKVLAAHQAGYIEFGTFALDVDALMDHADFAGLASKQIVEPSGALSSHYELFFRLFDDRTLARDIFFAVEDGRVDCRLRDKYRGLAPALVRTALDSLDARPSPASLPLREALVESLIRLSISGRIEEILPAETLPVYRSLCALFARVLNRNATVDDSAVATTRIYRLLKRLPNVSLQSEFCQGAIQDLAAESDKESADTPIQGGEPAEAGIPESEIRPYQQAQLVPYRGQTSPELVQLDLAIEMLKDAIADSDETGVPLTKEMLEELLKRGAKIKINQMTSEELADTAGLFITDLEGLPQEKIRELTAKERKKLEKLLRQAPALQTEKADRQPTFYYDEWDYLIDDYRPRWCRLSERPLEGGSSETALTIRKRHSALISVVRRRFERVRPEMLSRVRRLRSGEEIELDHVIEAVVDRRAGVTPSDRIYQKRERKTRDVATAFLLDMSASTDE